MPTQDLQVTNQRRNQICQQRWYVRSRSTGVSYDNKMRNCQSTLLWSKRRNLHQSKKLLTRRNLKVNSTIHHKAGKEEFNWSISWCTGTWCWNWRKGNELDEIKFPRIIRTTGHKQRCSHNRKIQTTRRNQWQNSSYRTRSLLRHSINS